MAKPRRKDQIRAAAYHQVQTISRKRREESEQDWRAIALDAILHGNTVTAAAWLAGVPRDRIYAERFRCKEFGLAFDLARYYGRYKIVWVSRPIWPPSAESFQRHEATFQRIYDAPCCHLAGSHKWR